MSLAPAEFEPPLDAFVAELNELARDTQLGGLIEIGKRVVERCYDGQLGAWRKVGRRRDGFRALARHPDLAVSASTLWRAVGLFELDMRLAISTDYPSLGVSHFRAVIGLPSAEQERLLSLAQRHRLAVEVFVDEVARARRAPAPRGRPRRSRVSRAVGQLERDAEALRLHRAEARAGSCAEREELARRLQRVMSEIQDLVGMLTRGE